LIVSGNKSLKNYLNRCSEEPHGIENTCGSAMKHRIRMWNVHREGFGGGSMRTVNITSLELDAEGFEVGISDSVPKRHDLSESNG